MTIPIVGPPAGQSTLIDGVVNDTVVDTVRRFLPPAYRNKAGWESLIAGLAAGDEIIRDQVFKAFDQLFLSSASGNYLIERAADKGVSYPENAGLNEELFRQLAVLLSTERQIGKAIAGILSVFYGDDSTRANMASVAEPFDLQAGDSITIYVDDRVSVTYIVSVDDFADINAATAAEVVGALNRTFLVSNVSAFAATKVIDGTNRVVIYSGALGLLGSLAVTGGMLNNAFQFATRIPWTDTYADDQWRMRLEEADEFRFTWAQDRDPNLSNVQVGDYVLIDCANAQNIRGSYEVVDVHIEVDPATGFYHGLSWFSIRPSDDFPYTVIGQPATAFNVQADEFTFYRPSRATVDGNPNPSFIAQHDPVTGLDIVMPVTTQAVARAADAAAYLHDNNGEEISEVWRRSDGIIVTLTGAVPFSTGQMVELRDVMGSSTANPAPAGSSQDGAGGWNAYGPVSLPPIALPPNSFFIAVDNPGYTNGHGEGGTAHLMTAIADADDGPYIFDVAGYAVTAIETTNTNALAAGRGVSTLEVASTVGFSNEESWIVIGFATQYEQGPIRCLGVIDGTNLAIDRSFTFDRSVPAGSSVILLKSKSYFEPDDGTEAFILTDTTAGRIAAESFIDETVAAGIPVNIITVYPGDRGLGGEGDPETGINLSDKIAIWAGDDVDGAVEDAHNA